MFRVQNIEEEQTLLKIDYIKTTSQGNSSSDTTTTK